MPTILILHTKIFTFTVNMAMRRIFYLVCFVFSFTLLEAKQNDAIQYEFEHKVDSLVLLKDSMLNASTMGKVRANNDFKRILREILNDSLSIQYDFSALNNLSVLSSPKKDFRIYTWTLRIGNDTYDYFGFTQYQHKKRTGFFSQPIIKNYVYALNNQSSTIGFDETAKLDSNKWLGCIYYKLVPAPKRSDDVFILLGWDGYGYRSTRKIIETAKVNSKGEITFGQKVIKYNEGTQRRPKMVSKSRLIFEYKGSLSMTLNYNDNLDMIVFDHLSPPSPTLAQMKFAYAPDFTYDALKYNKKKWWHESDIDVRNREEVKPVRWKPKDTKERTADTMIPNR